MIQANLSVQSKASSDKLSHHFNRPLINFCTVHVLFIFTFFAKFPENWYVSSSLQKNHLRLTNDTKQTLSLHKHGTGCSGKRYNSKFCIKNVVNYSPFNPNHISSESCIIQTLVLPVLECANFVFFAPCRYARRQMLSFCSCFLPSFLPEIRS